MNYETKLDRRRKYYLILDCETATLPYANNFEGTIKQKISIAKPLIYDLGWTVIDRYGNIYIKRNFLISEIFSVPSVFNTAYYCEKRPLYLEMLRNGSITLTDWQTAIDYLLKDLIKVESVGAYNSMFDYKKALPFTDLYIDRLYSPKFNEWETFQNELIEKMANSNDRNSNNRVFDEMHFNFRGTNYPMFDIWGLACEHILNCDEYRDLCDCNGWHSSSGKFYKTSAEMTYRFLKGNEDFIENHTALDDALIESEIFSEIVKRTKNKFEMGIIYFPFKIVGKVER